MNIKKARYIVGIDPGVNTGFAIWNTETKGFGTVQSLPIHEAMDLLRSLPPNETLVRIEDARKRKWFGNSGREQLQGAGSIKRDCTIWEDFLKAYGYEYLLVPPKNNKTKVDAAYFQTVTSWKGRTNEHSRDAGMLVFGF